MKEVGRIAVVAQYGQEVWERIERWPEAIKNFALVYGLDDDWVSEQTERARRGMRRARSDKDYALEQAKGIVDSGTEDFSLINVQTHIDTLRRKEQETAAHYAAWQQIREEENA